MDTPHLRSARGGFIFEAVQVKKPMHNVEPQLVIQRGGKLPGVPLRGLDADDDLAVLKRDYVRRAWIVHESSMNFGNPFVGNECNLDSFEIRKPARLSRRLIQAQFQRAFSKSTQRRDINANHPLAVRDADVGRHVSGRLSAWKFRVINRAPLLNVT